jgi:hypothetical protein
MRKKHNYSKPSFQAFMTRYEYIFNSQINIYIICFQYIFLIYFFKKYFVFKFFKAIIGNFDVNL